MASFLKRMKAKQKVKDNPVYKLAKAHEATKKRSKKLWDAAAAHTKKRRGVINALATGIADLFAIYVVSTEFNFSGNKCEAFMEKVRHKNKCVNDGLTTYDDIMEYEVQSTDKEYWPIKWTDYRPYYIKEHSLNPYMKQAKSNEEFFAKYVHALHIVTADDYFRARELLYLSALHDFFGFGLKRCKEFVKCYRHLQYGNRVNEVLEWLYKHRKLEFEEKDVRYFNDYKNTWPMLLKPKGLESA